MKPPVGGPRETSERVGPLVVVALVGAAVAYGAVVVWLAGRRQLGNDELFSLYFSRLPGLDDLWRELATGVEQTPPLFYVVTRASLGLLGDNVVALRFPELAGVLLAASCTLVAVTRRATIAHGALAAVLLLGTQATFYAHEARPYGIVLGLVALCYLLWQLRVDEEGCSSSWGWARPRRRPSRCTTTPCWRSLRSSSAKPLRTTLRRRPDAAVIAALGCALLPLLAAAPLIEGARAYSGSFWTEFSWRSALEFNGWLFRTSAVSDTLAPLLELSLLVWLVCGLALHALLAPRLAGPRPRPYGRFVLVATTVAFVVLVVLVVSLDASVQSAAYALAGVGGLVAYGTIYRRRRPELVRRARASTLTLPEIAAAGTFLVVPLAAVVLAELVTGAYTPRYVLPAALGVALLLPLGLHGLGWGGRIAPIVLTVLLVVFLGRVLWFQHLQLVAEADERGRIVSFLERGAGDALPIVIGHPQRFFELAHDAPAGLDDRLLHLASPELAKRYIGTDSTEAGLLVLRRFAPLDVRRFEGYTASGRPFLLLLTDDASGWNWVVPALEAERRSLRTVARADGMTLLEVT